MKTGDDVPMQRDVKKYPIAVSGVSGGIGKATAQLLSRQGWSILGLDIVTPKDSNELAGFYPLDLADGSAVERTCARIVREHSKLWGLIHIAGMYPIKPLSEYSLELWDKVNAVNVRSAFQMAKYLANSIVDRGRIVLVSSTAAYLGNHDVGYASSKAAILGLMKGLALNLSPRKILVNAVCPGPIDTPMNSRLPADSVRKYEDLVLLGRFGAPNEVAVAIEFLISPENTFVNGAAIDVTGGLGIPSRFRSEFRTK